MVNPDILKQIDKMLAADNTDVGDLAASDVTESQTDTQTDTQTDVQTDAQAQDQSVTDTPAQESNVTSSGNDDAQAGQVENVTSEGAKILGEDTAQNDFGDSTRGGDRDDTAATEADTDEEETSESSEENNEVTETDVSEEAVNEDTAESSTTEETVVADEPRIPIDTSKVKGIVLIVAIAFAIAVTVFIIFFRKFREYDDDGYDDEDTNDGKTISPMESGMNTVKIVEAFKGCPVKIGSVHDVGRRSSQQDSFGVSDMSDVLAVDTRGVLAVVADGMGGLSDGDRMSQIVVVNMLQGFDESDPQDPPSSVLMGLINRANEEVNKDLGPEKIGQCGSTVVAAIIRDRKMSWISVGDSHIYVWREGRLYKVNKDHNYASQLDERAERGEISIEEAMSDPQRAALTSFIGMGELDAIDQNITPLDLKAGDRVLLMSDGVYGTVGDEKLCVLLNNPFKQCLRLIDSEIRVINKSNQDNYTCVMIEIG